jgi:hypothetical protein
VLTSEWCFGPGDELPREVRVDGADGALTRHTRADLAAYCHLDANRSSVWMGGPEADPLAEILGAMARRDVGATRVSCRKGVGIVGWRTPDSFAALNRAIAAVFPDLRLERVPCAPGESPVACFRDGEPVELDQLAEGERAAIHIAATLHVAKVRRGVVLIDRAELHVPRELHPRWLDWLGELAGNNQLIVTTASPKGLRTEEAAA